MSDVTIRGGADLETWRIAYVDDVPVLGASRDAGDVSPSSLFTIYWRGKFNLTLFSSALERTERALAHLGNAYGRLEGFGVKTQIVEMANGLAGTLTKGGHMSGFDVYRAELLNSRGKLLLWANLVDQQGGDVVVDGENIAVSLNESIYEYARPIIEDAISNSWFFPRMSADLLLGKVWSALPRN